MSGRLGLHLSRSELKTNGPIDPEKGIRGLSQGKTYRMTLAEGEGRRGGVTGRKETTVKGERGTQVQEEKRGTVG